MYHIGCLVNPWHTQQMRCRHVYSFQRLNISIFVVVFVVANPSPPLDNIRVIVIVWRLRGNIIRIAPCWIVWHNVHSQQHTYVSSSYRSNRSGLSHWDPCAVHRGGCLELYYCNMVEWFWWDSTEWDVKPYTLTHSLVVAKSTWTIASLRNDLIWQHLSTCQQVDGCCRRECNCACTQHCITCINSLHAKHADIESLWRLPSWIGFSTIPRSPPRILTLNLVHR